MPFHFLLLSLYTFVFTVVLTELSKLAICVAAFLVRAADQKEVRPWSQMLTKVRASRPMLVPAGCFVLQQLLLVLAASALDAVSFQVFQQSFKLVPTAVFAYILLNQRLETMQWASIPVLAVGVILVTMTGGSTRKESAATGGLSYSVGAFACALSGLSSAYAGVHFEKYIKGAYRESLITRNIQLGAFGLPLSAAVSLLRDGRRIASLGALQGFDGAAWGVVALQVFGGLAMGMVVKHCDNIVKNFALAVSVVLTVLASIPLFGQWPSPWFLGGVTLIVLSVSMYARAFTLPFPSMALVMHGPPHPKRRVSDVSELAQLVNHHERRVLPAERYFLFGWVVCSLVELYVGSTHPRRFV